MSMSTGQRRRALKLSSADFQALNTAIGDPDASEDMLSEDLTVDPPRPPSLRDSGRSFSLTGSLVTNSNNASSMDGSPRTPFTPTRGEPVAPRSNVAVYRSRTQCSDLGKVAPTPPVRRARKQTSSFSLLRKESEGDMGGDDAPSDAASLSQWPARLSKNAFLTTLSSPPSETFADAEIERFLAELPEEELRTSLTRRLFPRISALTRIQSQKSVHRARRSESEIEQRKQDWKQFIDRHYLTTPSVQWSSSDDSLHQIKGATFRDLVYTITGKNMCNTEPLTAFLLTYRSYGSPSQLLNILIERFEPPPRVEGAPDDLSFASFMHTYLIQPVQIRVGKTLKRWVETHWYDFEGDNALAERTLQWIRSVLRQSEFDRMAASIEATIIKKMEGSLTRRIRFQAKPAEAILPKSANFDDFHPLEVARQLCLIEFEDYAKITPKECMNQSWTKADREQRSPHICSIIHRSNMIPMSVGTLILSAPKAKARGKIITKFIKIAQECDNLNNFNAVMEITAGLQLAAVYRLKKSWENVPKKYVDILNELRSIMTVGDNWKKYRAVLKHRDPPCIPYLDGHPDYLEPAKEGDEPNTLVNFLKCRQMSVVIRDIQQYQQKEYALRRVQVIYDYLQNLNVSTEDEMYKISLQVEPRAPKS